MADLSTILFSGPIAVLAGITDSAVFPVPSGVKSAKASVPADPVPLGAAVEIFFSYDGGLAFPRSASSTRPTSFFPRDLSHVWWMRYETADQPTHVKVRVNTPSPFSSTLLVETP